MQTEQVIQANPTAAGATAGLSAEFRESARFAEVSVTLRMRRAWTNCNTLPGPQTKTFFIRLPLVGVPARVPIGINRERATDIVRLVAYLNGTPSGVEIFMRTSAAVADQIGFERWKQSIYDQAKFEACARLLKDVYKTQ